MQHQRSRWRVAKMTAAFDQMLTRQRRATVQGHMLSIVKLAADTPAQLRSSDVYRVVDAAYDTRCGLAFCVELTQERPDLAEEILACMEELGK